MGGTAGAVGVGVQGAGRGGVVFEAVGERVFAVYGVGGDGEGGGYFEGLFGEGG